MEKKITNMDQLIVGEIYEVSQFINGYNNVNILQFDHTEIHNFVLQNYMRIYYRFTVVLHDSRNIGEFITLYENALTYLTIKQI